MRKGRSCAVKQTGSLGNGETRLIGSLCWSRAYASAARPICSEHMHGIFSSRSSISISRMTDRLGLTFRAVSILIRLCVRLRPARDSASYRVKPCYSLTKSRHARKRLHPLSTFAKMPPSTMSRLPGRSLGLPLIISRIRFPLERPI